MPTQSRPGTGRTTKKKTATATNLPPAAERRDDGVTDDSAAENISSAEQENPTSEVTASNLERREIPSFSISREARIAEAAYWRAERRGFTSGQELDDWLAAEREVDDDLSKNR